MNEDLIAHLRATGQAAFSRAMRRAAGDVKEVEGATVDANGRLRDANGRFLDMGGSSKKAAKGLKGFRSELGSSITTMVGSRIVLMALGGGFLTLAAILSLPLVSSLAAAALGFGALAIAAGAVAVPAMILAAGVVARFRDTAKIGGSAAWSLSKALDRLKHSANRAISPGAAAVMRGLASAARTLAPMIEMLREPFRLFGMEAGNAIREIAGGFVELGPEIRDSILGAARVLGKLAPAIAPFAGIILDIANASLPLLGRAAEKVSGTVRGWRKWFATTDLEGGIGTLVDHLKSWVRVGGGVLKIMVGIGRALMPTGGGWVKAIGDATNKWGDFLNSAKGIGVVRGIFGGIITVIKTAGKAIGFLVGVARQAGARLLEAFKPALPFFQNILLPLLIGIGKGVLSSVVGAFNVLIPVIGFVARVLGWLGTKAAPLKGTFEGIGQVIGFVFGGPILKAIGLLGKLGGVFRIIAAPITWVGRAFSWVGAQLLKIGGIGPKVKAAFEALKGIAASLGKGFVSWIANGIKAAPGALFNAFKSVLSSAVGALPKVLRAGAGKVLGLGKKILGAFADGGTAYRSGPYVVGERGPEVVNLRGGDRVTPNAALGARPDGGNGGRALLEITVVSELDRREIGRGFAKIIGADLGGA